MKDFINHIAFLISESGDKPSYEDVYTILKRLGKQPDDETMTREEYEQLDDKDKEELHDAATSSSTYRDLDPEMTTADAWKKADDFTQELERSWNKTKEVADKYDAGEALPKWKPKKKKKVPGKVNAFLFVCELCYEYGKKRTNVFGDPDIQPEKLVHKQLGTVMFEDEDEAMDELEKRKAEFVKKFNLDESKFTDNQSAIPQAIIDEDPDAYVQFYDEFEGEGEKVAKKRGTKPKGWTQDDDVAQHVGFETRTRRIVAEYVIYLSESFISKEENNRLVAALSKQED